MDTPQVEVRRSTRRRRTVSARREGERIIVLVPASLTRAEEERWVATMVARVQRTARARRPCPDADLVARAFRLSGRYLGGLAHPTSVRWVGNQTARWGSCTPGEGTIRLSDRMRGMPAYVVDYVLLHELAHLLVPGHGKRFWALLGGYERLERARGFLDGMALASGLDTEDEGDGADGDGGNDG